MGNSKSKTDKDTNENLSNESLSSSQLQIRSCIRNTRGNNNNHFDGVYPNLSNAGVAGNLFLFLFNMLIQSIKKFLIIKFTFTFNFCLECSRVFTIDVSGQRSPDNFTNSGYVSTESTSKSIQRNDGLPTYEEATGLSPSDSTPVGQVNDANQFTEVNERPLGRHRNRRRHRHHNCTNQRNDGGEEGGQRRHRRRGFRRGRHSNRTKRDQSET